METLQAASGASYLRSMRSNGANDRGLRVRGPLGTITEKQSRDECYEPGVGCRGDRRPEPRPKSESRPEGR